MLRVRAPHEAEGAVVRIPAPRSGPTHLIRRIQRALRLNEP